MILLEEQLGHAQIELGRRASRLTTDQRLQPAFCLREIVPAQGLERSSEIVLDCAGFPDPRHRRSPASGGRIAGFSS